MEINEFWGKFFILSLMLFMGIAFTFMPYLMLLDYKKKIKRCTSKTTAKVIEMQESLNMNSDMTGISWFPIYEYYIDNTILKSRSNFGQAKKIFYEGQIVDLFYNPDNWNEHYVPEENELPRPFLESIVN